ncbi:MAG: hypothetical protein WD009_10120, partial [Phycisphaeraceae bacterium]
MYPPASCCDSFIGTRLAIRAPLWSAPAASPTRPPLRSAGQSRPPGLAPLGRLLHRHPLIGPP